MGKSPVRLAYIKKLFKHISWQRLATSEAEVNITIQFYRTDYLRYPDLYAEVSDFQIFKLK